MEASGFSILQKFCNKQEEMSTNSLLFAVWDVYYLVFSNKKFWTSKHFPFLQKQLDTLILN